MHHGISLTLYCCSTVLLAACAASSDRLVSNVTVSADTQYPQSITIQANSFVETGDSTPLEIEPALIEEAIVKVIERDKLFSNVVDNGDYTLSVLARRGSYRTAGLTYHHEVTMDWSLTPRDADSPIWEDRVVAEDEATVSDAFAGGTRMMKALEFSVARNIEEGLRRLVKSGVVEQ